MLKKIENRQEILLLSFTGFAVLLKILFISVNMSYLFTYYTNYRYYGKKIAEIVLKNRPEYVMSDARNLRLFFYVERDLKMPIHPVSLKHKGWVISRHKDKMSLIKKVMDTPRGIYYIGIKNGGA